MCAFAFTFTREFSKFLDVERWFVAFPLSQPPQATRVIVRFSAHQHKKIQTTKNEFLITFSLSHFFRFGEKRFQFQTVHCVHYMKANRAPGEIKNKKIRSIEKNIFKIIYGKIEIKIIVWRKIFFIESNSIWKPSEIFLGNIRLFFEIEWKFFGRCTHVVDDGNCEKVKRVY